MPEFQFEDFEIHYELYGNPENPVITLVNGLSMRTSHWAPFFKYLPERGVRVLAYDMLGQGQSHKPILGVSFDDHCRSLYELHAHLGIDNPYVMGISFGGVVALQYAYDYKDACGGLIPASTFSELDPVLWGHAQNLYNGLAKVGFRFYLELLMPLNFSNKWLAANHELLDVIERVGAVSNELYGIQNIMESLRSFDSITHRLKEVECPTLIMNAEYDALTPRHLHEHMRREIANSRLMLIQHMSHAFTLEIPELTARILADFVHSVENKTWKGDQSVWIASDTMESAEVAYPVEAEHNRWIPIPFDWKPETKAESDEVEHDVVIDHVVHPGKNPGVTKAAPKKAAAAKKAPAKKTTTRKSTASKIAAKKPAAKTTAAKPAVKKAPTARAAAKASTAKSTAAKKTTTTAKKPTTRAATKKTTT